MTKSTITDERITSVIERLEHYACNLKWTNVRGAQDLLTAADGLRELQERRKADSEPVAEVVSIYGDPEAFGEREIRPLVGIQQMPYGTKLYRHAQPAPVVQKTAHSSVIAEQLANVLSEMKVTDHQRAVISCAVDRLNNVAQLLQLSPSALLVPEILDYQGAKELYNYLMTEEETNATVNGWNACRAAMLAAAPKEDINALIPLVSRNEQEVK
ncbi:TPA: hypothetical protein RRX51_002153 [Klebsiella pneumoniae]|nr:hypothetical protein [Klebsiella pneumoniae]